MIIYDSQQRSYKILKSGVGKRKNESSREIKRKTESLSLERVMFFLLYCGSQRFVWKDTDVLAEYNRVIAAVYESIPSKYHVGSRRCSHTLKSAWCIPLPTLK